MAVFADPASPWVERALSRFKLRQLRLVLAAAEHRSILRGAEAVGVSQPAATRAVRELEADLGVQLFERTNRGVEPTPFGEALLRHARLALGQLAAAAEEIDGLRDGGLGRVSVGVPLAAGAALLPDAITALRSEKPGVIVSIHDGPTDALLAAVRQGELDLLVGSATGLAKGAAVGQTALVTETLGEEPLCLASDPSHPLASRTERITAAELAAQDWVLPPRSAALRRAIDEAFIRAGCPPPQPAVESGSYLAIRRLLEGSTLIACAGEAALRPDLASGAAARLTVDLALPPTALVAVYLEAKRLSPAASALLATLRRLGAGTPCAATARRGRPALSAP